MKPNEATIPEGSEVEGGAVGASLDKSFGFSKHFGSKFEVGGELGRGHFGYTCSARFKKGEFKGKQVAVKVISKAKVRFLSFLLVLFLQLVHTWAPKFEIWLLLLFLIVFLYQSSIN